MAATLEEGLGTKVQSHFLGTRTPTEAEEEERDVRALRGGMYRHAIDGLISNLVLAVGLAVNLAGNFQELRHQYFLHMVLLLSACFIAIVALKNAVVTWKRGGDRALLLLWYAFVLRYISVIFTIISLAVAQTVVQKFQQYLQPSVVLTSSFASRFLSLAALVAFGLTVLDYMLEAPALAQLGGQRQPPVPSTLVGAGAAVAELASLRRRVDRLERALATYGRS